MLVKPAIFPARQIYNLFGLQMQDLPVQPTTGALATPLFIVYICHVKNQPEIAPNTVSINNEAAMRISFNMTLLSLLAVLVFGSAKKEDPLANGKELVDLTLQFDNVAGNKDLVLNSGDYTNASGESLNVSQLQYFVSNIRFTGPNGRAFSVNQDDSYFLIQESEPATQTIKLKVPAGEYNKLTFLLGVDSLRNTMPIDKRKGVLDPSNSMDNGMYWTWNSGYIFFKMEGTSNAAPEDPTGNRKFRYHIGGFGGYSARTINNIKKINLDLSKLGTAKAKKGRNATIHIKADILKTFNGVANLSIAAHSSVMFSEYSVNVANNYSKMFFHDRTVN